MPKCSMLPPTASIAAGITSRRSAMAEAPNTMHKLGAFFLDLADCLRQRLPGRAARGARATMRAPAGASRSSVIFERLVDHLRRQPRQQRRHHADLLHLVGRNPQPAGFAACAVFMADRKMSPATANGNDLHRRQHLAFDHRIVGRQRRDRDRLVDPVHRIDRRTIDDQHAGRVGEQVAAAGEGVVGAHALARNRFGDRGRRVVLRHVARIEPRHHDIGNAGSLAALRHARRRSPCPFSARVRLCGWCGPRWRQVPARAGRDRISCGLLRTDEDAP